MRSLGKNHFHQFLLGVFLMNNRFRSGRGTDTATLEAKLIQQLADLREEVLDVIFLYLHKVYDALYRSRCLDIL